MADPVKIDVAFDAAPFARCLADLSQNRIKNATAAALTWTVAAARDELRDSLGDNFTIRSGRVAKGISITSARGDNLTASVGSRDAFMALQVTGGDKRAVNGKMVAIPFAARPTPTATTPRSRWPGRLLALKNAGFFVAELHGGDVGVFKRAGAKGDSAGQLFYLLKASVHVKARWPFHAKVVAVMRATWQAKTNEAISAAIAKAKARAGA